ncbi:MAG: ATPase [Chloroflexota bacterium]
MTILPGFLAVLGAAIAQVGGMVGSSLGVFIAGTAGVAAIAEDPKQFRNVIILAALPLTQTFYAMIVMIVVLTRSVPILQAQGRAGSQALSICLITAMAEFFSAWHQGTICAAGISLLPKSKGGVFVGTMLQAVMVELIGVVGFVFAIMALSLMKLM